MTAMALASASMIMMTTLLGVLSESWLSLWMALEFNNMSFCCLIMATDSKTKEKSENIMKYFIVQSVASAIMLMSSMFTMKYLLLYNTLLSLVIITKSGMIPAHSWFIDIMTKMSKIPCLMLMTTQKILPIYMTTMVKSTGITTLIFISMAMSSIMQYTSKNFMIMMAYSSVFNMSWMFLASQTNNKTLLTMAMMYMITVMFTFMAINQITKVNKTEAIPQILTMIMLCSLSGMPPFMMFIPKWMLINEMMKMDMMAIPMTALIMSAINFYIYMRMFTPTLMNKPTTHKLHTKRTSTSAIIMLNTTMLLFLVK